MEGVAVDKTGKWVCPKKSNQNQFYICSVFLNNQCENSDKCLYIHPPVGDENERKSFIWLYQQRDEESSHFLPVDNDLNEEFEQAYKNPRKDFYHRDNTSGDTYIDFEHFGNGSLKGIPVEYKRLSTQSVVNVDSELKKISTHWIWYWENEDSQCIPFDDQSYFTELQYQLCKSYKKSSDSIFVSLNDKKTVLSFKDMTITFEDSSKTYKVKRRPKMDRPTRRKEVKTASSIDGNKKDEVKSDKSSHDLNHTKENEVFQAPQGHNELPVKNNKNQSPYSDTKLYDREPVNLTGNKQISELDDRFVEQPIARPRTLPRRLSNYRPTPKPRRKSVNTNALSTMDENDTDVRFKQTIMEAESEKDTLCRTYSVRPVPKPRPLKSPVSKIPPPQHDGKAEEGDAHVPKNKRMVDVENYPWIMSPYYEEKKRANSAKQRQNENLDEGDSEESRLRVMYDRMVEEGEIFSRNFESFTRYYHLIVQTHQQFHPTDAPVSETSHQYEEIASWKKDVIKSRHKSKFLGSHESPIKSVKLKNEKLYDSIVEQFDLRSIEIIVIKEVINLALYGKLASQKSKMESVRTKKKCNIYVDRKLLWYPIKWERFEEVCVLNLSSNMKEKGHLGVGFYLYKTPELCMKETDVDKDNARCLLLCEVLFGNTIQGKEGYIKGRGDEKSDICVDDVEEPSVFVLFNIDQICPRYIVVFKDKTTT